MKYLSMAIIVSVVFAFTAWMVYYTGSRWWTLLLLLLGAMKFKE